MGDLIDGVIVTPLEIISEDNGSVMHALNNSELVKNNFGEAYFSSVNYRNIKAWKCHLRMTSNIIVPVGEIRFVILDMHNDSKSTPKFFEIFLSKSNYKRLTIPAGIWFGFQGVSKKLNLLLNIADIPHDPNEVRRKKIDEIKYDWSIK